MLAQPFLKLIAVKQRRSNQTGVLGPSWPTYHVTSSRYVRPRCDHPSYTYVMLCLLICQRIHPNSEVFIHGGTSIAGWSIIENPIRTDYSGGTPISGTANYIYPNYRNPQLYIYIYIYPNYRNPQLQLYPIILYPIIIYPIIKYPITIYPRIKRPNYISYSSNWLANTSSLPFSGLTVEFTRSWEMGPRKNYGYSLSREKIKHPLNETMFQWFSITLQVWLVVTGTMEFWMTFHSEKGMYFIIPTDELSPSFPHEFTEKNMCKKISIDCCVLVVKYG